MSDRDLKGYGGAWPDLTWPNGAKLAVSVVVNFEEGAELQVGDGDPRSRAHGRGDQRRSGRQARPGPGADLRLRHARRRLADAATRSTRPRSPPRSSSAAARSSASPRSGPDRGRARATRPAVHGWRWRPHADYDAPEAEAADLDRADEAITEATGVRPVGFFCRGGESPWTRRSWPSAASSTPRTASTTTCPIATHDRAPCWSCPTRSTPTT